MMFAGVLIVTDDPTSAEVLKLWCTKQCGQAGTYRIETHTMSDLLTKPLHMIRIQPRRLVLINAKELRERSIKDPMVVRAALIESVRGFAQLMDFGDPVNLISGFAIVEHVEPEPEPVPVPDPAQASNPATESTPAKPINNLQSTYMTAHERVMLAQMKDGGPRPVTLDDCLSTLAVLEPEAERVGYHLSIRGPAMWNQPSERVQLVAFPKNHGARFEALAERLAAHNLKPVDSPFQGQMRTVWCLFANLRNGLTVELQCRETLLSPTMLDPHTTDEDSNETSPA
jgi:hypothetical protein